MSPIIFQSRKQSCKDFPPPQPPFPHLKMKSTPSGYAWNCYLPVKIMVSQTLRHGYLLKPFRIYFNLCMGDDGCEMDGKWITRCLAWFPPSFTLALCFFVTHFFFFFFHFIFSIFRMRASINNVWFTENRPKNTILFASTSYPLILYLIGSINICDLPDGRSVSIKLWQWSLGLRAAFSRPGSQFFTLKNGKFIFSSLYLESIFLLAVFQTKICH